MAKESGHSRISSLFSIGSSAPKGSDDFNGSSRGLRPILRSREPSPNPHSRSYSPARSTLRSSRSSHNLGSAFASADLGPGRPPRGSSIVVPSGQVPRPSTRDGPLAMDLGDDILLPPPPIGGTFSERAPSPQGSRASSRTRGRPESSAGSLPGSRAGSPGGGWLRPSTPSDGKLTKRASWLPGKSHNRTDSSGIISAHTRVPSQPIQPPLPTAPAFVVGPMGRTPYETAALVGGEKVPELWYNDGDLYVYMYDQASTYGPSFRIHSALIAASRNLTGQPPSQPESRGRSAQHEIRANLRNVSLGRPESRQGSRSRQQSARQQASETMSRSTSSDSMDMEPPAPSTVLVEQENGLHLYMQLQVPRDAKGEPTSDGFETLVRVRNMFAFLVGQVLVGTHLQPSLFAIFNNIAGMLRRYDFANMDGSTLGEAAESSFLGYIEDLNLADVRASREKTMEAIVLGERMRCWPLYKEGYVHAVGKWADIVNLRSPVLSYTSEKTRKRLEKSRMALDTRVKPIRSRLENFEFPSLFAGVLASSATLKVVDTKAWKASFVAMRKHTEFHYKARYGSWPPSAKSKKNDFEESGLNRIVAKEMYQDFCDLYDMLVDRTSLTTRSIDIGAHDEVLSADPLIQHLRKFMSEYDRSTPPVLPPIPFDIPVLPNPAHIVRGFDALSVRKQVKERNKKIKDDEINLALMQSYNRDSVKVTSFLQSFMTFERQQASGKTIDDLVNMRIGQWMFLYVIMQSLPLLAVDAPELQWTEGVEYWLCEAPRGSPPWIREDSAQRNAYYQVAGGNRVVSLPSDVIDHSVEGIYFRSHCWQVASIWNSQPIPTYQPGQSAYQPAGQLQSHPSTSSKTSTAADFDFNIRELSELEMPPPVIGTSMVGGRASYTNSPHGSPIISSMAMGLEALPLPPSLASKETRRMSIPDPSKSFDSILGPSATPPPGKKKHSKLAG